MRGLTHNKKTHVNSSPISVHAVAEVALSIDGVMSARAKKKGHKMVAPLIAAAAISGAASIGGGLLGQSAAQDAAQRNQRLAAIAAKKDRQFVRKQNAAQMSYADELNRNRIQWTVEDAKAAGIHPLAALGAGAPSTMPTFAVPGARPTPEDTPGYGLGDVVADAGKTVSNMITAQNSLDQRLQMAQIQNLDASSANMLAEAQSRSAIGSARLAGQSLPYPDLKLGFGQKLPESPDVSTAQVAQDKYGDIVENIFGMYKLLYDLGADSLNTPVGKQMRKEIPAWLNSVPRDNRKSGFAAQRGK